jgi:hypothetical protein
MLQPIIFLRQVRYHQNSLVADFLVERGDDRNDLNVFASHAEVIGKS